MVLFSDTIMVMMNVLKVLNSITLLFAIDKSLITLSVCILNFSILSRTPGSNFKSNAWYSRIILDYYLNCLIFKRVVVLQNNFVFNTTYFRIIQQNFNFRHK